MEPGDFISLAIRLAKSQNEGDLRSAVSRAYYGAFHFVREYLEDCGVRLTRKDLHGADIHRKVRFCLIESSNVDAVNAAGKLGSLRVLRNEADYDFDSVRFKESIKVMSMVLVSQDIVEAVLGCRAEPVFSTMREKIAHYARDVLRLPVQEP